MYFFSEAAYFLITAINVIANWVCVTFFVGFFMGILGCDSLIAMGIVGTGIFAGIIYKLVFTDSGTNFFRNLEHKKKKIFPAPEETMEGLGPLINEVCEKAGVEPPEVFLAPDKRINAYVVGKKTLVYTIGMLRNIPAKEIKGVIAHEIAHIKHGDSMWLLFNYCACNIGTVLLLGCLSLSELFIDGEENPFMLLLVPIIFWAFVLYLAKGILEIIGTLGELQIGRRKELKADMYACELGYGKEFLSFLYRCRKISEKKPEIAGPDDKGILGTIFSTHPSRKTRIKRLERALGTV